MKIIHCGEAGAGGESEIIDCFHDNLLYLIDAGITKLCNNLSLAISMIGTSEAMQLVKNLLIVLNLCVDMLFFDTYDLFRLCTIIFPLLLFVLNQRFNTAY